MQFDKNGNPTWRGCKFVPFNDLGPYNQDQARKRFNPESRKGIWRNIESWQFAVHKYGQLAKCPYIEPVNGLYKANLPR